MANQAMILRFVFFFLMQKCKRDIMQNEPQGFLTVRRERAISHTGVIFSFEKLLVKDFSLFDNYW